MTVLFDNNCDSWYWLGERMWYNLNQVGMYMTEGLYKINKFHNVSFFETDFLIWALANWNLCNPCNSSDLDYPLVPAQKTQRNLQAISKLPSRLSFVIDRVISASSLLFHAGRFHTGPGSLHNGALGSALQKVNQPSSPSTASCAQSWLT